MQRTETPLFGFALQLLHHHQNIPVLCASPPTSPIANGLSEPITSESHPIVEVTEPDT